MSCIYLVVTAVSVFAHMALIVWAWRLEGKS